MDASTIVAIVAAVIALGTSGIAIWQAVSARGQAREAKRQADAAEAGVAAAQRSAEAAEETVKVMREQVAAAQQEQLDREKMDQRKTIVELLHAGRQWLAKAEVMVMVMGSTPGLFTSTSTLPAEYGQSLTDLTQALMHARVGNTDQHTGVTIATLTQVTGQLGEHLGRLDKAPRDRRGHTPIELTTDGLRVVWRSKGLFDALEAIAAERFGAGTFKPLPALSINPDPQPAAMPE